MTSGRRQAIRHSSGDYWYVWDHTTMQEVQRFYGPDAEQNAAAAASQPARTGHGPLREQLEGLRGQFAAAAQRIYDAWEQDEDGLDIELGSGGICDQITMEIAALIDADTIEAGHDGDDHAAIIATNHIDEAYLVDIHPSWYEQGGGYAWTKIPDVTFNASMITIAPVDIPDPDHI